MKECTKCRHCYDDDVDLCPIDSTAPVFTIAGSSTISGRYLLERRLGQGGMGIVFRSKHKFLKSFHAVKIILPSLVDGDQDLLVRFNQEAVLAASIDHPNVIRVTDFGVENDIMPFLVMEYIDGASLSDYLIEGKPLPLKNALEFFLPVAEGVSEAHHKGIVHRDLKPQNVMVQKDLPLKKAIKVLDFGLAKIKSADSYPSLIQAKTMNIVGSPPYMSPEQWSGEGVDHRTDIYALAVLFYQMLTGRLPFQADSMPAMMYQHLTVEPPSAASLGVSLMPELEAVIQKALKKDPKERYESMDLLLSDLDSAVGRPTAGSITGAATEYMIPRSSIEGNYPNTAEGAPLSDSQKKRFSEYFDSQARSLPTADPELARDFLEAQDRIESAKTEAINADMLAQELVEARKEAEQARNKALQAKERMEADVRSQVEAEMKRLATEDQAKREAEAERLAKEVEARRAAEERANYLAQTALKAQQLAETERKKREEEAQQRELHQGVRQKAEVEAQELAKQVADAQRQYEEAKEEAAREARSRAELESKQKKIENEIEILTYNEAERRKMVEAQAEQQIKEQAARFEKDALDAKKRLDEAQLLIDQEAQKREQAEAARIQAEKEAERLSQEIVEVQRQMQEMRQSITYDRSQPGLSDGPIVDTGSKLTPLTQRSGQISAEVPPELLTTGRMSSGKPVIAAVLIGVVSVILLGGGGLALFLLFGRSAPVSNNGGGQVNSSPSPNPPAKIQRASIAIEGGTFQMGSDEIADKEDLVVGNQFPAHSETVGNFSIDNLETSNSEYAVFLASNDRKPPGYFNGRQPPAGMEDHPVTNITLIDARAYAAWRSKQEGKKCRLPEETEWEYAARNGTQQTLYPWGSEWRPDAAQLKGRDAVPVATSKDMTLTGIHDMLGNVSEWTSTRYSLYDGHPGKQVIQSTFYTIRGLSFKAADQLFQTPQLMITFRGIGSEDKSYDTVGFRLVCEP